VILVNVLTVLLVLSVVLGMILELANVRAKKHTADINTAQQAQRVQTEMRLAGSSKNRIIDMIISIENCITSTQ